MYKSDTLWPGVISNIRRILTGPTKCESIANKNIRPVIPVYILYIYILYIYRTNIVKYLRFVMLYTDPVEIAIKRIDETSVLLLDLRYHHTSTRMNLPKLTYKRDKNQIFYRERI